MGTPVLIIGRSGTGKSASMRFLKEPFGLVNVASKPLPFKSDKVPVNTDDYNKIAQKLKSAQADTIVIDDVQYLMANEFMRRAKENGYQKFTDIGLNFWNLVRLVVSMPPQ